MAGPGWRTRFSARRRQKAAVDYDAEWADAEDLDAEDYDFEPPAGDYDAERADAGGYGPGPGPHPGRPYPQGGTSHLGWTR